MAKHLLLPVGFLDRGEGGLPPGLIVAVAKRVEQPAVRLHIGIELLVLVG
ncbi:MAG TPA: hypothetical protein VK821_01100 [Dehalococcoidia bacterium]|nr:hypothetical protein [Dehalococcoidia bacterium]